MSGVVFHDVEVRAWPERADLVVIDYWSAELLAQYLPMEGIESPITDLTLPYERRSALAIRSIERDQDFLKNHFLTEDAVCLKLVDDSRKRLDTLLGEHGLTAGDSDFSSLEATGEKLEAKSTEDLFALLLDWHDVIERRYPAGSSMLDPTSWVQQAKPDVAKHFASLVQTDDLQAAYDLFVSLVNVSRKDFSFGLFLRWIYFHRTEFSDFAAEPLLALRS